MSKSQDIIVKHASACAKELYEVVVLPRAKEIVAASPTPYDDIVLGAIEPAIREALEKDLLKKLLPAPKVITGTV